MTQDRSTGAAVPPAPAGASGAAGTAGGLPPAVPGAATALDGHLHAQAWCRILFEQSQDGVLVIDSSGRVLEANPAMAAMLGRTVASVVGRRVADLGLGLGLPQGEARGVLAVPVGQRLSFEARVTPAAGPPLDLDISASAVAVDGQRLVFAVCRDTTLR